MSPRTNKDRALLNELKGSPVFGSDKFTVCAEFGIFNIALLSWIIEFFLNLSVAQKKRHTSTLCEIHTAFDE